MIADLTTILWKELREMAQIGDPRGRGKFGMLLIVVVMGVFLPLQFGADMIRSAPALLIWGWVPILMVSSVIADSFAGERERHTLEALLATRLSDRAILFGKLAAGVIYGCGLTWSLVLCSVITINVANWGEGLLLYTPGMAAGIVAFSILTSALAACAGVLVSLRAESVRQAQQVLSMATILIFLPVFAFQILPEAWQMGLIRFFSENNPYVIGGVIIVFLSLLNSFLLWIATKRFKRAELILN
jgi:ABC-2 type transport system permease protein